MQIVEQLKSCHSTRKLRGQITQLCSLMGWEYWVYTAKIPLQFSKNKSLLLTNFPLTWLAYYQLNKLIKIDPVYNHHSLSILPTVWETDNLEWAESSKDTQKFIKALKKHDWTGGIALPIHSQLSRGVMNFATKKPFETKEDAIMVTKMVGATIALTVHDQMFKLIVEPKYGIRERLSGREMEVLRYAADGLAAKVIADKIGIAERTVIDYLQSAAKKLGTASKDKDWKIESKNRQELIIKAFAFGFLNQSSDWDKDTLINSSH